MEINIQKKKILLGVQQPVSGAIPLKGHLCTVFNLKRFTVVYQGTDRKRNQKINCCGIISNKRSSFGICIGSPKKLVTIKFCLIRIIFRSQKRERKIILL